MRDRPLELGGETIRAEAGRSCPVALEISRMIGGGYALRLRLRHDWSGLHALPEGGRPDDRGRPSEVDRPGGGEELKSPYVDERAARPLRLGARRLALALPAQVLCREDCAGLCPVCAADLNEAGSEPQPRAPTRPAFAGAARTEVRLRLLAYCADGGPQEKAIPRAHRPAPCATQDPLARGQRLPALSQPAPPAPGMPGVWHLRRSRDLRARGAHDHDHD